MKQKIPLADAMPLAVALMNLLAPACERIMIAGSLRRQKAEIGDIEIVLIPKLTPVPDLFGEATGIYENALDGPLAALPTLKRGDRYKQVLWQGMQADLFICTPETWGCIATIRTGSADFTHWLVTDKNRGGAKPGHLKFRDGRLWIGSEPLDTSEEAYLFARLDLDWVAPEERIEGRWKA
jgi:DNA polymerase/3'-5' exonuclease PolX